MMTPNRKLRARLTSALAIAAGMALAVTGCASAEQSGGSAGGSDEVVVGFSGYTLTNPYFAGLIKGLENGAEEHGFRLIQTNSNGDNNVQASDIQNLVSQGADYIVVSPADASAIVPAIEQASESGATVIAISDTIESDAIQFTVAMNHVSIGKQSAQGIVDFLTEKYGEPKGKVVEMQGIAGSAAGADRTKGFDEIVGQYPGIEVVARADGGFDTDKTFQALSTILQAHPDVDAVMNANDSMAQGATKAIEAAGLFLPVGDEGHIFVTGNDAPAPAVADIRANRQDMSVASHPIRLAELVMANIAKLEKGEKVSGFIEWTGMIFTPANIASTEVLEYGIWADDIE